LAENRTQGLRQWIWRAFVQSALIPLILVETVLIAVYLLTNSAIRDAQTDYLREVALVDLQASARQESRSVDEQLRHVSELAQMYRNLSSEVLLSTSPAPPAPPLVLNADGVRHSPKDDGGSAVFYANSTRADRHDLEKVARMRTLDPVMRQITERNPLVASIYFNSWDSYNHIYPWFFTPDQYPHDMVIPNYNFYYLADAEHNPGRGLVWTDVYLDPAGHGWMMSAIAPVYRGDFLEGVVGLDITVDNLLEQIGRLQVPWDGYAVLVSDDLDIMALPAPGEADFGLSELTRHSYDEAIRRELFKPEDFNLARRPQTRALATAMGERTEGVLAVELGGRARLLAWTTIEQTGWHLLTVVDEQQVFARTESLAEHYKRIGYLLIAGLVLFYAVFFGLMWLRARRLSDRLTTPIAGISRMMEEIGRGHWQPEPVSSEITELARMATDTAQTGRRLEQSEAHRQEAQERLELVLESATESIWERNLRSGTLRLRGRFCKRFGLPAEQMDEADFIARVHPEDLPRVRLAQQRVEQGADIYYASEFRFADSAGRYHWLLSRGRVLERDRQSGAATLMAGTHVDIDALKQTEADLRHATLEAQLASQAKSRFISSISHELRTPLNAIHGFAQLMIMEREHPGPDTVDYLDEILMASRHLDQLVADLLEWSSIQAERPRLELQPVAVRQIMLECAELVEPEVRLNGLQLNLDLPDNEVQVPADPRRLRQVLLNLLSNAIKYNTPRGHITLSYQVAAGYIRLLVEDTGMGIAPELQDQLFEPFQRLGRENTAIQGTGIGLSICREFAALMNGRMGLHSETGIGSSFWIELPLWRDGMHAAPAEQAAIALPRVFYAEDNPASQFLVRKALTDLADVQVASDGRLALEQVIADPPSLLLLDLNLQGIDGEEVLRHLRENPSTRHLPVIILSAVADSRRTAALDCQGMLAKPVDLDELRTLVRTILAGGSNDAHAR
jgi:PAS domain S-box-containing protein